MKMSTKQSIEEMLKFVEGSRTGLKGSMLPPKQASIFSESMQKDLLDQWDASGREKARIIARITESDGNELFLTGWNGNDTFVGYEPDKGLGYVPSERVLLAELDYDWNSEVTLGEIRKNLDEMDRHQVRELTRRLTKRCKPRRFNEAKNFLKRFSVAAVTEADEKKDAPKKDKKDLTKTAGHSMVAMKDESFDSSVNRFKKLSEASSSKAPELQGMAKNVQKFKAVMKRAPLETPTTQETPPEEK